MVFSTSISPRNPPRPGDTKTPEDPEPGLLPVDPDQGPLQQPVLPEPEGEGAGGEPQRPVV
ncbi:MAG TPA: hypothetical protein VJN44_13750 [Roseateles sp.]|nr:hypothetical protein [Roseateles sp.]